MVLCAHGTYNIFTKIKKKNSPSFYNDRENNSVSFHWYLSSIISMVSLFIDT